MVPPSVRARPAGPRRSRTRVDLRQVHAGWPSTPPFSIAASSDWRRLRLSFPAMSGVRPRTCPKGTVRSAAVRLVVCRCEVSYTGRLSAFLPESTRLLMIKSDGSVLIHADAGGYKPLNWMTPPTAVEAEGEPLERLVVRKRAGKDEDRLEIRVLEVL